MPFNPRLTLCILCFPAPSSRLLQGAGHARACGVRVVERRALGDDDRDQAVRVPLAPLVLLAHAHTLTITCTVLCIQSAQGAAPGRACRGGQRRGARRDHPRLRRSREGAGARPGPQAYGSALTRLRAHRTLSTRVLTAPVCPPSHLDVHLTLDFQYKYVGTLVAMAPPVHTLAQTRTLTAFSVYVCVCAQLPFQVGQEPTTCPSWPAQWPPLGHKREKTERAQ